MTLILKVPASRSIQQRTYSLFLVQENFPAGIASFSIAKTLSHVTNIWDTETIAQNLIRRVREQIIVVVTLFSGSQWKLVKEF
jgi:hypothetical protein